MASGTAQELTESLLDDGEVLLEDDDNGKGHGTSSSSAYERPGGGRSKSDIIPYQGPFNVDNFIRKVAETWHVLMQALAALFQKLWGGEAEFKMSLLQSERVETLHTKLHTPFEPDNPYHQDTLRKLWSLAFPGEPCTTLKTPRWKDMGWQGEDPGTDCRGAGLFGLENLIYMAQERPDVFKALMGKTQGVRSAWEYPFGAAGINVTFMVSELLGLHKELDEDGAPTTAAGRAFVPLLTDSPDAFEELYVATFELLDRIWLADKASYMEFNAVLKKTRVEVTDALEGRPRTVAQLRAGILGGGGWGR